MGLGGTYPPPQSGTLWDILPKVGHHTQSGTTSISGIKKTVPVDILLDLPGHVVVDDVRDVLDVQAARHHVGGHQDLLGAVPELGQRQLSLGLGPVAEDAGGRKTLPDKDLALLTFLL